MSLRKRLKKSIVVPGVIALSCAANATFAATFTVESFPSPFVLVSDSFVETFEGYAEGTWNPATITKVGTFEPAGGSGSGSTCTTLSGSPCESLYLSDRDVNGQGNITPDNGLKALQANDTLGLIWNVSALDNRAFSDIYFGIRDAADQGATVTISLTSINGTTLGTAHETTLPNLTNSSSKLVTIALAGLSADPITSAQVSIISSKVNDSFTFDGGALNAVPAPGALALFGPVLAGLGLIARRRRQST